MARRCTAVISALLAAPIAAFGQSTTIAVPPGTKVYGVLDQQVTSNQRQTRVGDTVSARVWRNVLVDGETVIPAGTPIEVRVSEVQKRRIAGRPGHVALQAVSVRASDGTEIFLDGGYDQRGQRRIALAASLAAFVAWPTIFIRGKEAELPPGMVFDASVPAATRVTVASTGRPTLRLNFTSNLSVEVLYDEITEEQTDLPMTITQCDSPWNQTVSVSAVNERSIDPLTVAISDPVASSSCTTARGTVALRPLAQHFERGINRFSVTSGEETAEVILDIEM
jgi:hypothetical protein